MTLQVDLASINLQCGQWQPPEYSGDRVFRIGEWALKFRGWEWFTAQDGLFCWWAAHKIVLDGALTVVAPYPGPIQAVEPYGLIDFTPQGGDEMNPLLRDSADVAAACAAIALRRFDNLVQIVRSGNLPVSHLKKTHLTAAQMSQDPEFQEQKVKAAWGADVPCPGCRTPLHPGEKPCWRCGWR